jgi:polysaccharide deacetylase 2 family uncharacterized protein YibQ
MSENDSFDLPRRRETFLARYPRNLKLSVAAAIFALMVLPPAWIHGQNLSHAPGSNSVSSFLKEKKAEKWVQGSSRVDADTHAPALNDQNDRSIRLVPAPDSTVTEDTAEGSLPRIGESGFRPWQVYSRPFNLADRRPRISIVITDLGMSRTITDQAIQTPPPVTLSFNSQGPVIGAWGTRARQDGHETLLQIPVEPFDYPQSDPGPDTLLTNLSKSENMIRLLKTLRRATGYVGVTTTFGSRFTSDPARFDLILQPLRDRGLMLLDSRIAPRSVVTDMARSAGVPVAAASLRLDADLAPDAIQTALEDLEKTARQNGRAIGITSATPVMINQLQAWTKTLPERGIALAPLSAMVQ